ncbi:MAG: AAA family ATPase [Ardenticatenia bacterium]|nr:AAA family ATPase [Ardenticatenia bacterium]
MTCPGCQFQNPSGARFCAGCGNAMPVFCTQCGQGLVPGGRFCASCGTPVAGAPAAADPAPLAVLDLPAAPSTPTPDPPPPATLPQVDSAAATALGPAMPPAAAASALPASERRLVTILFADIVGSTSLGEQIDPEDLAELINGAFAVMNQAVSDAGGYIARLMGDGILAFFGAPVSHEDDPLRAVRAALAIRDGVKAYGARVATEGGPELSVRVGINSGLVLVGQMGSDHFSEYTTMGDAANTAARLQSAAPPGEVVISTETARLIRGAMELSPFGPLALKGKAEPVEAFLLAGPPPAMGTSVRGLPGITTPLVGRGGELTRLREAFEDAVESCALGWITLTGDAGVGKSRLTASFLEALAAQDPAPQIIHARTAEQEGDPYALVRRLLEARYGLDGSPGSGAVLTSAAAADLAPSATLDPERAARDLARLVYPGQQAEGGDDPRGLAERGLAALAALAMTWAEQRSLVLALEDLHWADDASLDAVARLAEALHGHAALILGNARPTLFERRPHWGEGERGHLRLDLKALSTAAIGKLVQALLAEGGEAVPEAVAAFVAERSEGNPYYVEELVEMLRTRDVLRQSDAGWAVDPIQLQNVEVPTTLQGVLQARLDALGGEERQALQLASILGKVFWDGAVMALGAPDASALDRLRGRGLVLARERSGFPEQREFVFKHALLCDAAYSTLLKKSRVTLHAQAATWMRAHAADRYGELAAQIGRHAELGGLAADAASHYLAAAARARARYANADAISLYGRTLALWPAEDPAGAFAAHKGRELALDMLGRRDEQRADLEAMDALAEGLAGTEQSYVHFRRAWLVLPDRRANQRRVGSANCADSSPRRSSRAS